MLTDERINELIYTKGYATREELCRAIEAEVLQAQEPVGAFYCTSDKTRWWQANEPYEYPTHKLYATPQPPAPCPETESAVRYLKAVQQMDAAEIAELKAKVVEQSALIERCLDALSMPCDRWNKRQSMIVSDVLEAIAAIVAHKKGIAE